MDKPLLRGDLVRLTALDLEKSAPLISGWSGDAEYLRLLDNEPAIPWSAQHIKEWLEKEIEKADSAGNNFLFFIETLAVEDEPGGKIIGFVGLGEVEWHHGDSFVGIGIGERDYWGRGYGTDAMRVLLRYAFDELNLHRVSLGVFEYNTRARRAYEKAGFVVEGRGRQELHRDGRRWDMIFMGILREEWQRARADAANS